MDVSDAATRPLNKLDDYAHMQHRGAVAAGTDTEPLDRLTEELQFWDAPRQPARYQGRHRGQRKWTWRQAGFIALVAVVVLVTALALVLTSGSRAAGSANLSLAVTAPQHVTITQSTAADAGPGKLELNASRTAAARAAALHAWHEAHQAHQAVVLAALNAAKAPAHAQAAVTTGSTASSTGSTRVTGSTGTSRTPATAPPSMTHTPATPPPPVHTQPPPPPSGGPGARLLAEAETRAGAPYVWGGNGPWAFDCSGLVVWAAAQLGISLPRTTEAMYGGGGNLEVVSSPRPGDLGMFGSGHVEIYVSPGVFFGAQQSGTLVGFHDYGAYYTPSEYLRVV